MIASVFQGGSGRGSCCADGPVAVHVNYPRILRMWQMAVSQMVNFNWDTTYYQLLIQQLTKVVAKTLTKGCLGMC